MKSSRSVFVAVPTYSGEISAPAATSLMRARDEAIAAGWDCTVNFRALDSMLPRCRNVMLTDFLRSGATDFVFWDADIATAPGAFARLLAHAVDFVGGLYRCRSDPERYIFRKLPGALAEDPRTGLVEVEGIGTGFMRVTRAAVERMIAAFPDLWVDDRAAGRLVWLFDFELRDHEYYSEDFVFCRRWRETGGKVWVDPDLPFHHIGAKTFSGRFADAWRRSLAARTSAEDLAAAQAALDALGAPSA